jgi:hypothetical protein
MSMIGPGRPLATPLGIASFLAFLGALAVASGLASLGPERNAAQAVAPESGGDDPAAIQGRIAADVLELIESQRAAGMPPSENATLVVPIRNGEPQTPHLQEAGAPRGGTLAGIGAGLLVMAGLLYVLFPPPPRVRAGR